MSVPGTRAGVPDARAGTSVQPQSRTLREPVVRHAQTLKAVTSANAIDTLRGAGAVYDGCVT